MIVDGTDNVEPKNPPTEVVIPYVSNVDGNTPAESTRTSQQTVLTNAVQTRLIGGLFSDQPDNLALGQSANFISHTINNNTTTIFTLPVSSPNGQQIIAFLDTSLYFNEVSAENEFPSIIAGVGPSNFQYNVYNSDWGLSDNLNVVSRVICRNTSGSAKFIILAYRWRILTFPLNAQNPTLNT